MKIVSEEEYSDLLSNYNLVLQNIAIKKNKMPILIELDHYYRFELGENIKNRGYLLHDELSSIMKYKLMRGKMRPLQKRIDSNDPNIIKTCTKKAIILLLNDSWENAIKILVDELSGVGIATASYICALIRPDLCPIMTDEVIKYFTEKWNGSKYTMKIYKKIQYDLTEIKNRFKKKWTLEDLGKAIWVAGNLGSPTTPPTQKIIS
jgi:hypothetical protein